jgi:hypothetical protein
VPTTIINQTGPRERIKARLRRCLDDPSRFNHTFLKRPSYWWRQVEICDAIVRYKTVVVVSGNATGKDYAVGGIVPWWLWTKPRSLVFVTGPSQTVLGTVTWKEIRRAISGARVPMGGSVTLGAKASPLSVDLGDGWQALGYSTTSIERASGQHDPNLLVVVEEASSADDDVAEAIRGLNPSRLLLIGNPLRGTGWFVRLAKRADRERDDPSIPDSEKTHKIVIPSTDSPDIRMARSHRGLADRGFLDEARRDYGEDSLWWKTHVDAQFPEVDHDGLLKQGWIDRCVSSGVIERVRELRRQNKGGMKRLSADLSEGTGRDKMVLLVGDDLGIVELVASDRADLSEAARLIDVLLRKHGIRQDRIVYDAGGRGKDLPRYLEQHRITEAIGYRGSRSGGGGFTNLRSRCGWLLRRRLDPDRPVELPGYEPDKTMNPLLARQASKPKLQEPFAIEAGSHWVAMREELLALKYALKGPKTALEDKEAMASALGHSPDYADAILMLMSFGVE